MIGKAILITPLMYRTRPCAIFFLRVHERVFLLLLNNGSGYWVSILQQISNISMLPDRVVGIVYDISLIMGLIDMFRFFRNSVKFKQWRREEINTGRIRTRSADFFQIKKCHNKMINARNDL